MKPFAAAAVVPPLIQLARLAQLAQLARLARLPRLARLALLALLAVPTAAQQGILALGGRDPVATCRGAEVEGKEQFHADHFVYTYRFADADNLATFLADPDRWCIQMGGGCARMGPLSGRGDPDRFLVYDQHIYIFASDDCREGFAKDPERFVWRAPLPVAGEPDAVQKGNDAVLRAVACLGGAERLDALKNVRFGRSSTTPTKEGPRRDTWCQTIAFPDRLRRDQTWGNYRYATIADGDHGFFQNDDGTTDRMHSSGVRELRARELSHPLVLLRHRDEPGFRAVRIGSDTVDGKDVDLVHVACGDVVTTLAIARDDGAVLQQRRRGRGPQLWFGDIVETMRDFRAVDGVSVPHTVVSSFDGGEPRNTTFTDIEFDVDLPADFFASPFK